LQFNLVGCSRCLFVGVCVVVVLVLSVWFTFPLFLVCSVMVVFFEGSYCSGFDNLFVRVCLFRFFLFLL